MIILTNERLYKLLICFFNFKPKFMRIELLTGRIKYRRLVETFLRFFVKGLTHLHL